MNKDKKFEKIAHIQTSKKKDDDKIKYPYNTIPEESLTKE